MNRPQTRLTIIAWFELLLYYRRTKGGFGRICRLLAMQRAMTCRRKPQSTTEICNAVNLAACLFYKPVPCLARSVVTVCLLRKHGIDACLVIGYRPSPFFAHAWVEINGEVVNDSPAYREQLIVLYRQNGDAIEREEVR